MVEHGDGPLLVVAGAGTGKTRVITERICRLLECLPERLPNRLADSLPDRLPERFSDRLTDRLPERFPENSSQIAGEHILGLTFTDKAAAEMKSRVEKSAGGRARGVWLSTFHKFCIEQILRPRNATIEVIENEDHWVLLRRNIRELGLKHYTKLASPGEFLTDFVEFFSRCQDELVTPEDFQRFVDAKRTEYESRRNSLDEETRAAEEENLARFEEVARAYRVSERLQREKNLITFGGQLLHAVEALRNDTALRESLRERYRYILVDEFQDTNIAQLELLWLLAGGHTNIVAVGDDNQAIYRFRGASFGSFTIFLERFCGAAPKRGGANLPLQSLTRNYRSSKRILDVAAQVIQHNERPAFLPHRPLVAENPPGEKIRIVEFAVPEDEARWIVEEIEKTHAAGRPWRASAVLYRKHNHARKVIDELRRKKIPFVIRGLSVLNNTLVRDLIAYLRVVAIRSDNVAFARVFAAPYWGFEPRDLVRLAERAKRNPLYATLESPQREFPFEPRMKTTELLEFLKKLRAHAARSDAKSVFEALAAELGLFALPSDADRRNAKCFADFLEAWQRKSDDKSLASFIEYFDFFLEAGGQVKQPEEYEEDAVELMTVHAAKGLEFDNVFVLALSEGDFPARPQTPALEFPPELMKEEQPKGGFRIQEERRLFYVAMTRARRRLTLSTVVNNRKKPSPFLEDILENPKLKAANAEQLAPQLMPLSPENDEAAPPEPQQPLLFPALPRDSRAYSKIALWAKAFHPPRPEPLQLSPSSIETYRSCPMKYLFQQSWSIRGGPQAVMTFGSVMHTAVREFVAEFRKKRRADFAEASAIFECEWIASGFEDDFQEEEYRKAGLEQLRAFCESYAKAPADVLYQEKPFELALEPNVIITGRMDQVNRTGPGKIEIIDYKTGNPKRPDQARKSIQLSLYALAAREIFEFEPERLIFYNLTTNEAVAAIPYAKALKKAKDTVVETADSIRAGDFGAKPGYACRTCDYKLMCPAHEQLISLAPLLGS